MPQKNKPNKSCYLHEKKCKLICTNHACQNKIICEKCVHEHIRVHSREYINDINFISDIHSVDKVQKMRQALADIIEQERDKIMLIYKPFKNILNPIIKRLQTFQIQSKSMIDEELRLYLANNKKVIEATKTNKSKTKTIQNDPNKMIQETFQEVEIIHQRQNILKKNSQKYAWYCDATEELCHSAVLQIQSFMNVLIKLLDNYTKIQASHFTEGEIDTQNHHQKSFYARYANSHKVASMGTLNEMEMALIEARKQVDARDQQIKKANNQITNKVNKIQQMSGKIDLLKKQLIQWQKKLEKEQLDKQEMKSKQRKKNQQFLIKLGIIGDNNKKLNFQKKTVDDKYFGLVQQMIPQPLQINLTQHKLNQNQLQTLCQFRTVQILKMNFIPVNINFLKQAFSNYEDLQTLQLNTNGITDQILTQLSYYIPKKLKHLYLMDNSISDDGLEAMFKNMQSYTLQSLYVSYNNLTSRSTEIIRNYAYNLKVLHISKNQIKSKGAVTIGKHLKEIKQLFIGGTGVTKQGILAICRNNINLRRLNLVGTELSTDIVSQILLGLQKLEWLDISYSSLTPNDIEKINKLKIFNKNLEIICNI